MEIFFVGLSAISTLAAAAAAWFSYQVSKDNFKFQKKVTNNQATSYQFNHILVLLIKLKVELNDIEALSDDEFLMLEPKLQEIKKQINVLAHLVQLRPELIKLRDAKDVAHLVDQELDLAIKVIKSEIKALWA
ncbi:hypothetical protein HPY09_15165 [Vibrio cholerae]|uniref:hypothetical protein n=1 Tax=Vibrio cholerae TaxID=666 RepID=UPI001581FF3D|nr:hypothetical protein [Vibrio cholerae]QKU72308.1 hypothetical protein HPY09_15165 [Vibrio cholerae]QKU76255.1 hypothetical protein HPY05_15160 [Vibrio cholerae]